MANIYLDKFDKYIEEYINQFDKGKRRHRSTAARHWEKKKYCLTKKLKIEKDETVRQQLIKQIREIIKERQKYPASDEMDLNFRRMKYVRYADDFLIGVIGTKEECEQIKEDIKSRVFSLMSLILL